MQIIRENKDYANALRPRRFKRCDFLQIFNDVVAYAHTFNLSSFFSQVLL